jgi:hypothetical protein
MFPEIWPLIPRGAALAGEFIICKPMAMSWPNARNSHGALPRLRGFVAIAVLVCVMAKG